jgi:hypothetical protein
MPQHSRPAADRFIKEAKNVRVLASEEEAQGAARTLYPRNNPTDKSKRARLLRAYRASPRSFSEAIRVYDTGGHVGAIVAALDLASVAGAPKGNINARGKKRNSSIDRFNKTWHAMPRSEQDEFLRVNHLSRLASKLDLSPACIYTIRHSRELHAAYFSGGYGELREHSPWVTGAKLFRDGRKNNQRVSLVFAPAEADIISGVIYWALIDDIEVTGESSTTIKFSDLQPFEKRQPLHSLIKLSDGVPLSDKYIRPYVPCRTPDYLFNAAAPGGES